MIAALKVLVFALVLQHASCFSVKPRLAMQSRSRVLKAYYSDDDKPAFSLGSLLVLTVGVVGIFGEYHQPLDVHLVKSVF